MSVEPPPGYVDFVERHLEPLRRDALRIVDDDDDADGVSSAVLTDVAIRWRRFELLHRWLGRADPAGAYLPLAFARRSAEWKAPPGEIEVEVWSVDEAPPPPVASTSAATSRAAPTPGRLVGGPGGRAGGASAEGTARVSAAVRIARVRPPPLATISAFGEASIAWWHAYEAHVRHKRVAAATAAFLAVVAMVRLHSEAASF
jgi:hypothetical protein